ncbi:hypothetical protein NZK35_05660 [Stieleria sp. ICT_E10.1]|uniref:hypothetical protein n=1 Tax=Stieleria sedimenti TaxID=2976331 RepID=UPI00217F537F|nr:hypothetical protein [Stieleria sedimenti]MCS7466160.1 hypothetical protein [Stieleria sedimenti]
MNAANSSERNVKPTDDQRSIAENSDAGLHQRDEDLPHQEILLGPESRLWIEQRTIKPGGQSLIAGMVGLAAITFLLGIMFPLEIHLLNKFDIGQPIYIWMMMIVQSMLLPPMVGFSFAATTPMFWYGSIVLRFAMAIAAVLPGCIGFVIALDIVEGSPPGEFFYSFSLVMFACLMTIAMVALTTQLWSRWTLSHARSDVTALPPTGIRTMIELTGIAAIGCAVLISSGSLEYLTGIYLFGGIGFMAAIAIICTQIAFLREGPRSRTATLPYFGLAAAFAAAFILNGFFGVMEYGRDVLTSELFLISAASLYGALVIYGVMWICLSWLRFCGWQCIDRKSTRQRRGQSTVDGES